MSVFQLEKTVDITTLHQVETIAIEAKSISVYYRKKHGIYKVSLRFPANRVTALIGPSGCGKTTLLRSLNRMNDEVEGCIVSGAILFSGVNINAPSINVFELRKRIGMVFQEPNVFAKSVYQNVAFGPIRHGVKDKHRLAEIVEESLQMAALWDEVKDKLHSSALTLSGGQQQRLCIARAIALQPEILLLDEPTSSLDPISTGKLEQLIGELKKNYTIIFVTHDMQQAARISDYTAFFHMGKLIESGRTKELFTNPKDERTERFISGRFG